MKPIIIANWKMHFLLAEAVTICSKIMSQDLQCNLIIAVPSPYLAYLSDKFQSIQFCAQNVSHFSDTGAYTGEFSTIMLKSANIDYVIIGHSERRNIFAESDELIAQKVYCCFKASITPIICIGETLSDRNNADYRPFLIERLITALSALDTTQSRLNNIIIAYEPIWSIGTNVTPTQEQLTGIFADIYYFLQQSQIANNAHLVYGGSVNLDNIQQILNIPNVNGVLVGKSSLDYRILLQMLKLFNAIF